MIGRKRWAGEESKAPSPAAHRYHTLHSMPLPPPLKQMRGNMLSTHQVIWDCKLNFCVTHPGTAEIAFEVVYFILGLYVSLLDRKLKIGTGW
jgi:hypothetical protein